MNRFKNLYNICVFYFPNSNYQTTLKITLNLKKLAQDTEFDAVICTSSKKRPKLDVWTRILSRKVRKISDVETIVDGQNF